jgi:uncharacterized protein with GYD domain
MPKYLFHASYTTEGVKGIRKGGGSARRAAVKQVIESVGGKLEAFYFAFGKSDAIILAELPDNTSAAGLSLAVGAVGAATTRTTVLLTPEEIDAAAKKAVDYRPPGA